MIIVCCSNLVVSQYLTYSRSKYFLNHIRQSSVFESGNVLCCIALVAL